ncbi:MAG: ABC transporter permease [Anaerolineae bacterium]|jgi:ribose transport system permease protein|nr:ABC transporter permease [Anaerolineae bacterium]MDH7475718.1 ABC transporter permease [Anaerolineae bacterium]
MTETARDRGKRRVRRSQFRELNVLVALFLLCLFFYWRRPEIFVKPANLAVIMRFIATFGMLAIGEVLIIITGGIDLSVGSMLAFTGVITAWMMLKGVGPIPPIDIIPAILITLVIGALIGTWHGLFVTKLGIPPFIITLGTYLIARGLAANITRGYPQVFDSGHPFLILGQGDLAAVLNLKGGGALGAIPISFLILLGIAALVSIILNHTPLGYRIYAVGGNIEAARLSGVNVDRVRIFCYATSGFLAALTGVILASRLGQGTPVVGAAYELWAIAAAVIGGTSLLGGEGTVLGAILGAAIMGVMQNGMVVLNISSYVQDVILGTVLVVAVVYDTMRRGGRFDFWKKWFSSQA